jgi:hypothetical protein
MLETLNSMRAYFSFAQMLWSANANVVGTVETSRLQSFVKGP